MTRPIYHLALPADWASAVAAGSYRTSTRGVDLDEEGFIHCSYADQVVGVARRFYADVDALVLLTIDPSGLDVRDEPPVPGATELFPHVYGPIGVDAIVDARTWDGHPPAR